MNSPLISAAPSTQPPLRTIWNRWGSRLLGILAGLIWAVTLAMPAHAVLNDDRYDGNIFALYGSNGGIIPARTTLDKSIQQGIPAVVVFYIDDSSDCKQYAPVIASLQVRYGMGVNFLVYNVDALDLEATEDPSNPARFYRGQVPQTLLFDRQGDVIYQSTGNRPIDELENPIRALFELDPVTNDPTPQQFNEVQTGYKLNSSQRAPQLKQPSNQVQLNELQPEVPTPQG
jgi:thiol-disulfide isomerase/thioredoxin